LATELVQAKRDLSRTKQAELAAKMRRSGRKKTLKSGGVLTVAQGRQMVAQRANDDLIKAQKVVEAARKKKQKSLQKWFSAAAKKARKWRMDSVLEPLEVYDSRAGCRLLRKG